MFKLFNMELYKLSFIKKVFVFFVFLPVLICLYDFLLNSDFKNTINSWQYVFGSNYSDTIHRYIIQRVCFVNFICLVFLCFYYFRIEYRSKCFNIVLTLPLRIIKTYNVKLLILVGLTTLNCIVIILTFTIIHLILTSVEPIPFETIAKYWCTLQLIVLFQFFMAYATKSFVIYSLSFISLFALSMLYSGRLIIANPYYFIDIYHLTATELYILLIHGVIFYLGGFIAFKQVSH